MRVELEEEELLDDADELGALPPLDVELLGAGEADADDEVDGGGV